MAQQAVPRQAYRRTVYEDARVRILEVQTQPATAPQRHNADHIWVTDDRVHFSPAGTTHVEPNREVIIELSQSQTGRRNVCAEVLAGEYLHCHEPGPEWLGANLQIQFETDQMRVGILQVAPNAGLTIPPEDVPALVIALEGTEAEAISRVNGAAVASSSRHPLKPVEVLRSPADQVNEIRNVGSGMARFLVIEFGGAGE
jgi:hypothetical protein